MFTQPGTGCGAFTVEPANRRRELPHLAGDNDLRRRHQHRAGVPMDGDHECALDAGGRADPAPASCRYAITENPTGFERLGTLTVQGVAITIVQARPAAGTQLHLHAQPGPRDDRHQRREGMVTVTVTGGTCAWSARAKPTGSR